MISFPNCKINLGLNIIRKREDNYHDIETLFYPVNLTDALEIISSENDSNQFTVTGLVAGDTQNNLCLKAYDLLKISYPTLPFINMHLHKAIPVGAGLGGGSADAVFTLTLLKDKFLLACDTATLQDIALQLGSDCPFFLYNRPCFATSRGEVLTPIDVSLAAYKIMVINPGIQINTAHAFSEITPASPGRSIREIIAQPVESWKNDLRNDFEIPVFKSFPVIKQIKERLYQSGAVYASLSGSGSTVYGIFKRQQPVNIPFPNTYFTRVINME